MARRKKNDLAEEFYGLFMAIPAWVSIPVAIVAFFAVRLIALGILRGHPVTVAFVPVASMLSYLAPILILIAGLRAAQEKIKRRNLLAAQSGIESIRNLDWKEFEMLVGEAYRRQGYEVAETGGGGADGGIDLKLRRNDLVTVVQCKQWRAWKVGVKPIRELYGVMMAEKVHRAIFVTSGE